MTDTDTTEQVFAPHELDWIEMVARYLARQDADEGADEQRSLVERRTIVRGWLANLQLSAPTPAPAWPSFQPHPDDKLVCYVCGRTEGAHGLDANHCPPWDITERRATNQDVLPLELDDGTRITCAAISGGADSTDGIPNSLALQISGPGEHLAAHRFVGIHTLSKRGPVRARAKPKKKPAGRTKSKAKRRA